MLHPARTLCRRLTKFFHKYFSSLSAILWRCDLFAGVAGVAFTVATLRVQQAQVLCCSCRFFPLLTRLFRCNYVLWPCLFVFLLFKTIVRIILIALRRPSLFICLNLSHSSAAATNSPAVFPLLRTTEVVVFEW